MNNNVNNNISYQNKKIVQKARLWIGTPFRAQGRSMNVGCDCIGFIIGLGHQLNAKSFFDKMSPLHYFDSSNYDLHKDSEKLLTVMNNHFPRIYQKDCNFFIRDKINTISCGDIILSKIGWRHWHISIVSSVKMRNGKIELSILHACLRSKMVIEEVLLEEKYHKIQNIYRFYIP